MIAHVSVVYSVVLDPTRNQACSGSMDGTVRIWNLQNGTCQHTLTGHTSLVGLLGLSPSYLVSAAADSTLRIWDPETGELRHTLSGHTGAITCFQHDEFKVLSGSDGTLKMWDIRDGTPIRDLLTGIIGVWQVVFEGRWCVAASNRNDQTVLDVWDFGDDHDDEDWVGEPPGGLYDEDTDAEEDVRSDTDAMDQDMEAAVPSEPEVDEELERDAGEADSDEEEGREPMDTEELTSSAALHGSHTSIRKDPSIGPPRSRASGSTNAPPLPNNDQTPTRPRTRSAGVRRR
jgi:F-box and WD-40 domain protein CDC4